MKMPIWRMTESRKPKKQNTGKNKLQMNM